MIVKGLKHAGYKYWNKTTKNFNFLCINKKYISGKNFILFFKLTTKFQVYIFTIIFKIMQFDILWVY